MDLNVRLAKMTKAMKTQLFIDNLTTIFNPQALFSDGTAQYRIPPEPKANESVKLSSEPAGKILTEWFLLCVLIRASR